VLKITILDGGAGQKLKVEGKVAEPWVSELESAWNRARRASDNRRIEVDLSAMTFIDLKGEATLMAMIAEGARLTAKGVYCEYVVKQLVKRAQKTQAGPRSGDGAGSGRSGPATKSNHEFQRSPMKEMH
jgi:hypothetical protein